MTFLSNNSFCLLNIHHSNLIYILYFYILLSFCQIFIKSKINRVPVTTNFRHIFRNTISWSYFVAYPFLILTILFGYVLAEIKLFCQKKLKKAIFLKIDESGQNINFFYFLCFYRVLQLELRI